LNLKIVTCIFAAFIVSFLLLFAFSYFFPTNFSAAEKNFYSKNFDDGKKIILVGSSHVGQINATFIEDSLAEKDYKVYNLAYQSDVPIKRSKTIDKIIRLKPTLVAYGVSYRDFDVPKDNPMFDPKEVFGDLISKVDFEPNNPKLMTLEKIHNLQRQSTTDELTYENTPFFTYNTETQIPILSQDMLEKQAAISEAPRINLGSSDSNKQVMSLIRSINAMKVNNIKVVLFTTPLHRTYLDGIDEHQKSTFEDILNRIKAETGTQVYDLTSRYSDMPIWANISHVAFNVDSLIYSQDISDIIQNELDS